MTSASESWDREYRQGRYRSEPLIPFVDHTIETLGRRPEVRMGRGLYIGCRNGRNYIPLCDAGLDLWGLDVAGEALEQLGSVRPDIAHRLIHLDLGDFEPDSLFDYVIAIQVFQHGPEATVRSMIARTTGLLKDGGLLFVRFNSASTEVYHPHEVIEKTESGGFTVMYTGGSKTGLSIHFLSRMGLEAITSEWFTAIEPIEERVMPREAAKHGYWGLTACSGVCYG
ncbi:MAG: class I SAM-dependent methyltransferase [SAR202 cluster bacterium]|nr:class I SAM-dependent methyltransferase [SAR202 cluster bacterium]